MINLKNLQYRISNIQTKSFFIRLIRKIVNILNRNRVLGVLGKNTTILKNTLVDEFSIVGTETFINEDCMITKSKIGNYCSIGSGVIIGPGQHNLDSISLSSKFYKNAYDELTFKPCEISHDVWIGANAIIMRGVKVGTGAAIGAGSIVTKDVPPFAVVVGVPARILKFRFEKEKQNIILSSHWFEKNINEAKQIINDLEKND